MSVPKPTAWPSVFTWTTVHPIADYLNEPILAARSAYNEHWGTNLSSEADWQRVYLPKYPSDGWLRYGGGIPDYQIIGPHGIGGFGLHEFMGHPEIVQRGEEMRQLYVASLGGAIPLPPLEPQPPSVEDPTMPVNPTDPSIPLPPGTPSLPSESGTGTLPPGTPDPNSPPLTGFRISVEFTGRVKGSAQPVAFEDVTLYRLPATGKVEVVVKRADVPKPNFFIGSLTDVGFVVTVTRSSDGAVRTYERPEGKPVEALLYFE